MKTTYLGKRKPTAAEAKKGAEIVFIREDEQGNKIEIMGSKCYESWEQWGAIPEVLSQNVGTIEKWRNNK